MKHGVRAACVMLATWALCPSQADSAGVYENAAAESAFLLAPDTIVVRASLETTGGRQADATVYRIYGSFPVRSAFLIALEQPLVSVTDSSRIDSGLGDLVARVRARIFGGPRGAFVLTGSLGTGTGEEEFYPYASGSIEFSLGAALTDSVGAFGLWLSTTYAWERRVPDALADDLVNSGRVGAGVGMRIGPRAGARVGATFIRFSGIDAHREMVYAGAGFAWTPVLRLFAEGQVETGPVGARVSDWAVTAGAAVWF